MERLGETETDPSGTVADLRAVCWLPIDRGQALRHREQVPSPNFARDRLSAGPAMDHSTARDGSSLPEQWPDQTTQGSRVDRNRAHCGSVSVSPRCAAIEHAKRFAQE